MDAILKDRILRRLDGLSDERGYQLLDFLEFLESKYAQRATPDNFFARVTDTVTDTMRASKIPIAAINSTLGIFDGASKVAKGVAAAAGSVIDEASKTAKSITQPSPAPAAASPVASTPQQPVVPPAATPAAPGTQDGS